MKTRLTSVTYLGFTAMDRRFSNAMLPWLLKEISATGVMEKLSITIEEGYLKAYNANFEPVLIHRLVDILRASQVPGRPERLFYILLNEVDGLLNCYLFEAATVLEVTDLFVQMREPSPGAISPKGSSSSLSGSVTKNIGFQQYTEQPPWTSPSISLPNNCRSNLTSENAPLVKSTSNASNLTSLCVDLSPSDSHFFEVLYIGKVRISQRKVPESLIDDALHKLAQHEFEKVKNQRRHSLLSSTGTSVYSNDSNDSLNDKKTESTTNIIYNKTSNLSPSTTPLEPYKNLRWTSDENLKNKIPEHPEIDKEFDSFTKERIEKNNNVQQRKPSHSLEANLTKNNLGTVTEDEEKHEELTAKINATANSITEFCLNVNKNEPNKDNNPFNKDSKSLEDENSNQGDLNRQESLDKINFDEVSRKPRSSLSNKVPDFGENRRNSSMPENKPFLRDRSASIGIINLKTPIAQVIGEQNRTMLFQVGRSEIRLISPDRKQILLHRAFKDVSSVVSGRMNRQHIGFVCRETNETYACYVFSCESEDTAKEILSAIKQAFTAHAEILKKSREKSPNLTCEHCPMLWYHRLCHDVEGMNDKKSHAFILRRIEQLSEDEQDLIITKYQGGTNHIYETSEHNSFLMMLLRAHCEAKQLRHVHDTAENRSEFLNQYLGGSTIFMKAKRSLSNSFDHLLKRKASRDEAHMNLPKKEASPLPTTLTESPSQSTEHLSPEVLRGKSLSPQVVSEASDSPFTYPKSGANDNPDDEDLKDLENTSGNSPMMEIFLKVSDSRNQHSEPGHENDATWRQTIYEKVLQPTEIQEDDSNHKKRNNSGKRTKEQLRLLWKLAIEQTVLLVRMERENTRLKQNEESSAVRRIKLEYTDLANCDAGVSLMWDSLLARQGSQPLGQLDTHMLAQAVLQGVPRMSRGAIWYFLAEQASLRTPPPDVAEFPLYRASYASLLSRLTKHQHAIFIDLGRTFPKHEYFASALGPGQLALYNILKAYSILDPQVGYCQGLSFVAGVLLLHMEEAEAFTLLRHLMFRRGLRKQYLPDMSDLQVRLYQLSRLVRDHEPDLHLRLEALDISAALYAAPWMLTLFTSQFPLGFVVRVFDLMFLESPDIIFSFSLALLSVHKDGLMLCESCEEAAEYLKYKMPDMDQHMYDKVMKKVHSLDISRQLSDYAVEYAVLREEMPRVASLTDDNRRLISENNKMAAELDSAMDAITNYQKCQARLEAQTKLMEQQLTILSRFITHCKQDPPIEVKRIIQSYTKKTSFSSKIFSSKFSSNEEEEYDKKIFKTGTSAPNLFAKINKDDLMNAINKEKSSPEKADDRKHFVMKKSQSVHSGLIANNLKHYPLKSVDEKYERTDSFRSDGALKETLKEIGKKNSGFFASTHEQIRQERMFEQQLKHDFDENLKRLDARLAPKNYIEDLSVFQSRKTMSLNLSPSCQKESSKLNDSGFVTPLSPTEKDRKDETSSVISHPLSDVDVDIKFDGNTQLKQIRPLRRGSVTVDGKQA